MSEPNEEPKIIVDEDWKSQVEREKAQAAAKSKTETAAEASDQRASGEEKASEKPAPAAAEAASPATGGSAGEAGGMEIPEASFSSIVTLFFTQAMMMLGQFPDPTDGKPKVDKKIAKHYIDTMEVLQEKTKGNLSSEEERMLSEALHAARMAFVAAK